MRRVSATIDSLSRPPDDLEARLFVIFTRAEADAVVKLSTDSRRTAAALQAIAKIQAALGPEAVPS